MTQKEVLRKIIDLLTNELRAFDFGPSYKEQGFIRRTSGTIFVYQFLIYNRTVLKTGAKVFLIEPYIWVGIKEIEKYYKEITLNTEIKTDTDFITIGNSIAGILANPNGLYENRNKSLDLHVFDEKHILLVAEQLLKQFKEVALPYCLKYATVGMVDKIINTKPDEYKVHTQNDNYRILKGIIAAKLNNNPDLDELIKIYDKQIIERDMYNATDEMLLLKGILPKIKTSITDK
ncbi:hypothetical protein CLV51_1132 [Chitinophaga niastensis]|uniref:Uncharacterized protein n=1 Tax=Chitinophaga niastensis TaxID=536980 RepID=A0A2P8H838_CHINA|nr:hypothetical protein [Chitinophaga niastensis]PSL42364.1 hypothetical protein CLV51_1132 [Chitinophaga niastensis]